MQNFADALQSGFASWANSGKKQEVDSFDHTLKHLKEEDFVVVLRPVDANAVSERDINLIIIEVLNKGIYEIVKNLSDVEVQKAADAIVVVDKPLGKTHPKPAKKRLTQDDLGDVVGEPEKPEKEEFTILGTPEFNRAYIEKHSPGLYKHVKDESDGILNYVVRCLLSDIDPLLIIDYVRAYHLNKSASLTPNNGRFDSSLLIDA
jgi:hypothetical protein